jgi:hypothetical protein
MLQGAVALPVADDGHGFRVLLTNTSCYPWAVGYSRIVRFFGAWALAVGTFVAAGESTAEPAPPATAPATSDPKASDARDAPAVPARPSPIDGLGRNAAESFWGWNLALHLTAIGQTALMSRLDVDYEVRQAFHHHTVWGQAAYPAVILGVAGPVGVISGLFAKGYWGKNDEALGAAYAVLQANALTLGYVTVLKLITGRPPPKDELVGPVAPDMRSLSHTFRFGVGRGGIVHGWPSGHVAVTMATCSSLAAYYPDSWALKLAGAASVDLVPGRLDALVLGSHRRRSHGLSHRRRHRRRFPAHATGTGASPGPHCLGRPAIVQSRRDGDHGGAQILKGSTPPQVARPNTTKIFMGKPSAMKCFKGQ